MILAVVTAIFLQAAPVPARQAPATGSIAGVVVNSVTGDPLQNVQVTAARTDFNLGVFGSMVSADLPPAEIVLPGALLDAIKNLPADAGGASPNEAAVAFASLETEDIDQIIVSPTGAVSVVLKSVAPVMTDNQGRFRFDRLKPGEYRLITTANGFAKQEAAQRASGGTVSLIALTEGEAKRNIVVRMAPTGAISGRIADNRGRAIAAVPVQLFRFSYDQFANKQPQPVASAQTDDRGEYRFYFLSPGRYYLKAGHEDGAVRPADFPVGSVPFQQSYVSPNRVAQNYGLTYYPGTADINSAGSVELQPGADLSGIDLFLGPQQTYRVRGRVIDSRTGQAPAFAMVTMTRQTVDLNSLAFGGISTGPRYRPDGTFEVENVTAGSYTLSAQSLNPNQRQVDVGGLSAAERKAYFDAMEAEQRERPKASLTLEVTNRDVDGVTMILGAASLLSGRFQLAPEGPAPTLPMDSLNVQLRGVTSGQVQQNTRQSGTVKPDGTFSIEGLAADQYRLSVQGLPAGFYVKEARLENADVLNAPIRISGSEAGALAIVISGHAGRIQGNLLDSRGQAAPAAQVVLIPDGNRYRTELFRPVTTDAKGHFVIESVVPGNYRIAAWESLEPFGFFDPDRLRQADQNGKPIRVTESSEQDVTIAAWP
jgi:protocatechuate 3,4-dioxygenase beta subunit